MPMLLKMDLCCILKIALFGFCLLDLWKASRASEIYLANHQVQDEVRVFKFSFARQTSQQSKLYSTSDYFLVELHRAWAPFSYDRFLQLAHAGYFREQRFYRAIKGFVLDWNYAPISGLAEASDPLVRLYNSDLPRFRPNISDREAGGQLHSNIAGTVVFGQDDDGSTKSEIFVNLADNSAKLDSEGFWPVGKLLELPGRSAVAQIQYWQQQAMNFRHGDIFFSGNASNEEAKRRQTALMQGGNGYIDIEYPLCSYIQKVEAISTQVFSTGIAALWI